MKSIFPKTPATRLSQRQQKILRLLGYIFVIATASIGISSGFSGYFLSTENYAELTSAFYGEVYALSLISKKIPHSLGLFFHISIGTIYMLMAIYQFNTQARRRSPQAHRAIGKVFVITGALTGITGLYIAIVMPFAGQVERAFATVTALWFLYALYMGYGHAKQRKYLLHREWMIRSFAVALAAVAMRFPLIIMNRLLSLDSMVLFILAAGSAHLVVLTVAEWWIRSTRQGRAETTGKKHVVAQQATSV
ncbi:DUF2306 domain-containing protein [Pseudomonas sp. J452]|uniref:DUF2306 domain-containing protein n=1 Tax=Pseudomonas sp. J452 TaxID=2898441 RepID=UPI0021ADE31F|nr:DUF2306 domain-containing protein [Pseudomonas sp. J452]UUY08392.1 DUF2306 domain-containing protein [Pseudomonas sp. J452]